MKNTAHCNSPIRPFAHSIIRLFDHSIISPSSRRGFSLIEMLVVLGILAVLIGAGMASFSSAGKKAQKTKGQELVLNVATALEKIYQDEGAWPLSIIQNSNSEKGLDERTAYALAKRGALTLTRDDKTKKTTALDQCGIVSPWATAEIKRLGGKGVSESTRVSSGGTIASHRLRYAVDTEGLGIVKATVGGEQVEIRGVAAVWCAGYDGKLEKYSDGLRKDDIYSWSNQQKVRK